MIEELCKNILVFQNYRITITMPNKRKEVEKWNGTLIPINLWLVGGQAAIIAAPQSSVAAIVILPASFVGSQVSQTPRAKARGASLTERHLGKVSKALLGSCLCYEMFS